MKIRELEKALREIMSAYPGRPALELLAGNGSLSASVPKEFAESARTLASRSADRTKEDSVLRSHPGGWV